MISERVDEHLTGLHVFLLFSLSRCSCTGEEGKVREGWVGIETILKPANCQDFPPKKKKMGNFVRAKFLRHPYKISEYLLAHNWITFLSFFLKKKKFSKLYYSIVGYSIFLLDFFID